VGSREDLGPSLVRIEMVDRMKEAMNWGQVCGVYCRHTESTPGEGFLGLRGLGTPLRQDLCYSSSSAVWTFRDVPLSSQHN
jgi:hypothetical protein